MCPAQKKTSDQGFDSFHSTVLPLDQMLGVKTGESNSDSATILD